MKRILIAGTAIAALFTGTAAMAQDNDTLTIAPEQGTVIKQYVVKERVKPVTIDEDVTVGTTVPGTIDLSPVPEEIYTTVPATKKYEYFYWKDRVVFVDPDTRKVVDVVD